MMPSNRDWLIQLVEQIQRLFRKKISKLNASEDIESVNDNYLPVRVILKPEIIRGSSKPLIFLDFDPPKLLPPPKNKEQVKELAASGLGNFKPDELEDEEIAHTYGLIEEIKATLKRQQANKNKERKKYERQKKGRMALTKVRAIELAAYFETLQEKPKHHMLCFIMYDIENNRIRTKVAKYLEEKGLKRVQKSVFFGEIDKRVYQQVHEVLLEIQSSYENTDSLLFVPVSEDEMKSMKLIGKEVSFEYAILRQNTLFF